MILCGIDLGTTFSAIAHYDEISKRVTVIPDADTSQLMIPSAVFYKEDGTTIVGWDALNVARQNPDRLVQWIKMSMGDREFKKNIGNFNVTPEEVSAEILKKLKRNAEMDSNQEIEAVVITVPAYFGDNEREATMKAAELAGLKVLRLLAEPSAASLAYVIEAQIDLSGKKHVLVSDLGGGTYDVTLLQTESKTDNRGNKIIETKIICKDGSIELGGKLWDDKLEEYMVEECLKAGHQADDPRADTIRKLPLREEVIKGKQILTRDDTVQISCGTGNTHEVTRSKFEELTAELLLQVEEKFRDVIKKGEEENGIPSSSIDPILLVGGSSRMPMIERMIENITGKKPITHRTVDLLVAIGAAYDAYIASGESVVTKSGGIIVTPTPDIARKAVGIKVNVPPVNAIIIEDGSAYETEFSRKDLATMFDNQREIEFAIYEGNSSNIDECKYLASVTLPLPPNQPQMTPVEVTLKYDANGIITGHGMCRTSEGNKEIQIMVDRKKIQ